MVCFGRPTLALAICFTITLVDCAMIKSKFRQTSASGASQMTCALKVLGMNYLATKIDDTSDTCTSLDWTWGENPTFDTGFTYYEKTHVVEVFQTPLVHGDNIRLPIKFDEGSRIDMYVEFTSLDFSIGAIQLVDTLNEPFHIYSGESETLMVLMEVKNNGAQIQFKAWRGYWENYASMAAPFTIGPTFKITFKALADNVEILIDDTHLENIDSFNIPTEDARMITFGLPGGKMNKIEFVGV